MRSIGIKVYRRSTVVHGCRSSTGVHLYRRSTVVQV